MNDKERAEVAEFLGLIPPPVPRGLERGPKPDLIIVDETVVLKAMGGLKELQGKLSTIGKEWDRLGLPRPTNALVSPLPWRAEVRRRRGGIEFRERLGQLALYLEPRDWWIGYYRGSSHHYVCVLPCLVIRWNRR